MIRKCSQTAQCRCSGDKLLHIELNHNQYFPVCFLDAVTYIFLLGAISQKRTNLVRNLLVFLISQVLNLKLLRLNPSSLV